MNKDKNVEKNKAVPKDVRSMYLYWRNIIPKTIYQKYVKKYNCVLFGSVLVHAELRECEDKTKKAQCEKIIKKARECLKRSFPARRTILLDSFLNKTIDNSLNFGETVNHLVYKLSADDVGNYYVPPEQLSDGLKEFSNRQYKHSIGKLQEIDEEIYDELKDGLAD